MLGCSALNFKKNEVCKHIMGNQLLQIKVQKMTSRTYQTESKFLMNPLLKILNNKHWAINIVHTILYNNLPSKLWFKSK